MNRLRPRAGGAVVGVAALVLMGFSPAPVANVTGPVTDAVTGALPVEVADLDLSLPDLGLSGDLGAYIVRLQAPPATVAAAADRDLDVDAYRADLAARQDAVLAELATRGVRLLTLPSADALGEVVQRPGTHDLRAQRHRRCRLPCRRRGPGSPPRGAVRSTRSPRSSR